MNWFKKLRKGSPDTPASATSGKPVVELSALTAFEFGMNLGRGELSTTEIVDYLQPLYSSCRLFMDYNDKCVSIVMYGKSAIKIWLHNTYPKSPHKYIVEKEGERRVGVTSLSNLAMFLGAYSALEDWEKAYKLVEPTIDENGEQQP